MKIVDIYESEEILLESFKDFKRIAIGPLREFIAKKGLSKSDSELNKTIDESVAIFKDGVNRGFVKGNLRDIGYWTKTVNDGGTEGIEKWLWYVNFINDEIKRRVPLSKRVFKSSSAKMEIFTLENLAALLKYFSHTDLCVRKQKTFDRYLVTSNMFVIKTPGGLFAFISRKNFKSYEIWNEDNIQLTVEEFIEESRIQDYPKGNIGIYDRNLPDFIDDVTEAFYNKNLGDYRDDQNDEF